MKLFSKARVDTNASTTPIGKSIFVGSPGDLSAERDLVATIIGEAGAGYSVDAYRWDADAFEHSFSGSRTPQSQIPRASSSLATVVMFSERIGSPVPDTVVPPEIRRFIADNRLAISCRPRGNEIPLSGSVFELLDALQSRRDALILLRGREPLSPHLEADERGLGMHRLRSRYRASKARRSVFRRGNAEYDAQIDALARLYDELTTKNLWWPKPFESEEQLERELRGWLAEKIGLSRTYDVDGLCRFTSTGHVLDRDSVSRGLGAARFGDEVFGRRWEALGLIKRMEQCAQESDTKPFALIVGRSGSGKSSFAQSAVANELARSTQFGSTKRFAPLVFTPSEIEEASPNLTPHAAIAIRLATCLGNQPLLAELETHAPSLTAEAVIKTFARHSSIEASTQTIPVVVVNQFEETLAGTNESFAQRWAPTFEVLSQLCERKQIWVVITLLGETKAEGFWRRFEASDVVARSRQASGIIDYELRLPDGLQLERIVTRPFLLTGRTIDEDWSKRLVAELDHLRAADPDLPLLPLVSLAIEEKFDQLDRQLEQGFERDVQVGTSDNDLPTDTPLAGFPEPIQQTLTPPDKQLIIAGAVERLGQRASDEFLGEGGHDFDRALSRVFRRLVTLDESQKTGESAALSTPDQKYITWAE